MRRLKTRIASETGEDADAVIKKAKTQARISARISYGGTPLAVSQGEIVEILDRDYYANNQ